ncbi:Bug family tripartite tricarboxylate transporter substrate binding protein [Falsiroseomonas tokyonensis]|uniref:Bug family tripartite tricarboxylate transporter substrate binding protein n=1 Tax=Falsiroseomonas tokyonensis TaxID=430521 RepID=A0ABV7BUP3_9PROT|nr:tripartite tricarboxylate transporter substrate-binding protein [Falsiroseomonas tokyonensis]MBU8537874.1 tripartite tricarboxylate transporter substrate binding protein [Falsiroseomonas tokyonensis]
MFRRILLGAAAALLAAAPALAQPAAWPGNRQVRILITYPPGGTSDFVARLLAQRLGEQTGGQFVVDNRSGGGGIVGWTNVVRSANDGTTLLLTDNSLATAPPLYPNLGFDVRTDFTPISLMVDYPTVFVVPGNAPARTLRDYIEAARGQAADANFYGSMGSGSSPHLYTEYLQDITNIRLTHVPYRGMGPAFLDLMAGRVGLLIAAPPTVLGAVRDGRARAIAIGTTGGRIPALPDVPTAKELGYDFTYSFWYGLLGPRGMDAALVAQIRAEVNKVLENPEVRDRFVQQGATPVAGDGAALAAVMESDLARWSEVVRAKGITVQ